jgi:anaerobic selenocysteine-containing dehydrogenase/Fe-S-cluster-containing dehydrogenase component
MSETKRRDFLRILGIGSAASFAGCTKTAPDALAPYVVPPEEVVRGHALWYASTCRECPAGCGVHVRLREGRVHKVEGNPAHPVNGGGLCARGQAAVQGLYNPDRLRTPLERGRGGKLSPISWAEAEQRLAAHGDAIGLVTGPVTGAMAELARAWKRHLQYEPIAYEGLREANRLMFGIDGLPVLRFADARAIYLFGADVIETFISPVGYARGIADARRAGGRMVYFGSRLSLTGARADEWVQVGPGGEGRVAMALVREILAQGGGGHLIAGDRDRIRRWSEPFRAGNLEALAREFMSKPSLAVANGAASALAVNLLNLVAGGINRTVRFDRTSSLGQVATRAEVTAWQQEMEAGRFQTMVTVDSNPVYSAPGFAQALAKVPFVVCLSSYQDETVEAAHLVLPVHTPLESWGDYEPWTGVHCLQQPAMRPVFDTREAGDILIGAAKSVKETSFREFLRNRWRRLAKDDFETFWIQALERGGYWAEAPERRVTLTRADLWPKLEGLLKPAENVPYTLQTYPSVSHFDGRGANRPWLQELPDPITQVVWDSWVEINPRDAAKLKVAKGDLVRVRSQRGQVDLPVYVYPGIQPGSVAIPLGQGHTAYGRYATGVGVNAMALVDTPWSGAPVEIQPLGRKHDLAIAAGHDLQEHRGIARSSAGGERAARREPEQLSIYPPHEHKTHRWGMLIDLDACNGCSACVTACYAENNIPVAGKEQVSRGRIRSWIRLERFFGTTDRVSDPFQIDLIMMLCQQCDKAPCEPVCPVFAAYHTEEGLNGQVYNRCVGTRYCANNCPYKVRRFNWFPGEWPAPLDWQLNPDVTVRSKGVMEKCTFCVQRITEGKDRARRDKRTLADGDITPACAQSCPARAIVFGDLNDKNSRVSCLARNERRYRVFEELNTRPAVTYLERERRKV